MQWSPFEHLQAPPVAQASVSHTLTHSDQQSLEIDNYLDSSLLESSFLTFPGLRAEVSGRRRVASPRPEPSRKRLGCRDRARQDLIETLGGSCRGLIWSTPCLSPILTWRHPPAGIGPRTGQRRGAGAPSVSPRRPFPSKPKPTCSRTTQKGEREAAGLCRPRDPSAADEAPRSLLGRWGPDNEGRCWAGVSPSRVVSAGGGRGVSADVFSKQLVLGPTRLCFLSRSLIQWPSSEALLTWPDLLSDPSIMGNTIQKLKRGRTSRHLGLETPLAAEDGLSLGLHQGQARYISASGECASSPAWTGPALDPAGAGNRLVGSEP